MSTKIRIACAMIGVGLLLAPRTAAAQWVENGITPDENPPPGDCGPGEALADGEGGAFAASAKPFMAGIEYGLDLEGEPICPVNPSGGLIACGHPVGATGLMQGVFALWQLQGTIENHFGRRELQVADAKKGAIHSHAGTGTYVTVSILEKES